MSIVQAQNVNQTCIDACNRCMQACEECLTACLKEPDVQARVHCMQLLHDCADICALASQ
ncbi:four-helix bundle copper-binding protein [Paenibacillus durus]|uniref:four-helix bundle copper-binding protein n=1 Tax=Paenibacillus durus TaxID=44251 RepID=UPI0038B32037